MAATADPSPGASSLRSLRDRVDELATPDGAFVVVAAAAGVRPVPAAGLRFDSLDAAREAARLTQRYRRALRRYDSRLPQYDVVARRAPRGRR